MAIRSTPFGAAIARGWNGAFLLALLGSGATPLWAQSELRDTSIANLPRPGYEPRILTLGAITLLPTLDSEVTYSDNIFATPQTLSVQNSTATLHPKSDAIFTISPKIVAELSKATLDIKADAHAGVIRYASTPRENVNTFGFGLDTVKTLGSKQSFSANLGFERTYERRSDPEADLDLGRPPALINDATGEFRYQYQGPRVGALVDLSVENINYLPAADADRDLTTYRAGVRGLLSIGPGVSVYVEPYVNRRDARLRVDRNGVDRDNTTFGGLAGLSFDITDLLQGNIGVGAFSANPDDPRLRSFTGLATSGRLTWHPRVRTVVTLTTFRGDVATVRAGALGRVDTNVGLSVDQEVRHNLILRAAAGFRNIHYRSVARDQRYLSGQGELRYLLNRTFSLVASTTYTHRRADVPNERFNRWESSLGLRVTL